MDGGKFFGAFRACSGIKDAIVINHVPIGCDWGVSIFKNASNHREMRKHACTVLDERDVVFGGEDKLKKALKRADMLYDTPLLIVLAGDVPSIIGDDIDSVIKSASIDKEVIWMEAAGFKGTMREGYEDALLCMAKLMRERNTCKGSINIIGLCRDDYKFDADIKEIKQLINDAGIKINCIMSSCSVDELKNAPAAELNVVVGQGIKLAKFMKNEFSIPYVEVNYPYGLEGTGRFVSTICENLGKEYESHQTANLKPFEMMYLYMQELYATPVSIIGDMHAKSMSDFLEEELGFDIRVRSSFEDNYHEFEKKVRESDTSIIFGSSFERNIAKEMKIPLIRFNYPVFDQICAYDDAPFAGFKGAVCLTETIVNTVMGSGV